MGEKFPFCPDKVTGFTYSTKSSNYTLKLNNIMRNLTIKFYLLDNKQFACAFPYEY